MEITAFDAVNEWALIMYIYNLIKTFFALNSKYIQKYPFAIGILELLPHRARKKQGKNVLYLFL